MRRTAHPVVRSWIDVARQHDIHVVGGFCERDGDELFNSAAIVGPSGLLAVYRKLHLWGEEALYFETRQPRGAGGRDADRADRGT